MNKQINRENWGTINPVLPELNLTQIQIDSYKQFLETGIRESLTELNPIKDFTGKIFEFEFLSSQMLYTQDHDPQRHRKSIEQNKY